MKISALCGKILYCKSVYIKGEIMKRKSIIYIACFLVAIALYKVGDKILDKVYLSQYSIEDYTDSDRFKTINKVVNKRFKHSDKAVLVNTANLDQGASATVLAYQMNVPLFYTEKFRVMTSVYSMMEKLGVKDVVLVGGVNALSEPLTRSLDRNGYRYSRISQSYPGIDSSIDIAEQIYRYKKFDSVAVVTRNEFDIPNAISFLPYACEKGIPIIVMNNDDEDQRKLKEFIEKYKIKKGYLLGNKGFINKNIESLFDSVMSFSGNERYEINRSIMDRLYGDKSGKKVFISKGGELMHKRHIAPGQLVNALGIAPLAADNKSPLMYVKDSYFSTEESRLIDKKGYTEISEVGFKIERRNFFNIERFKDFTTVLIILINIFILIFAIYGRRFKSKDI